MPQAKLGREKQPSLIGEFFKVLMWHGLGGISILIFVFRAEPAPPKNRKNTRGSASTRKRGKITQVLQTLGFGGISNFSFFSNIVWGMPKSQFLLLWAESMKLPVHAHSCPFASNIFTFSGKEACFGHSSFNQNHGCMLHSFTSFMRLGTSQSMVSFTQHCWKDQQRGGFWG